VRSVPVDGATNSPGSDADVEVDLDIEVAGGVAPAVTIAVYLAPNTDQGFIDAITTASQDAANRPSVISIRGRRRVDLDGAGDDLAGSGLPGCGHARHHDLAASGDGGSADGATDGLAHVDFPASSPHVLGCGGTTLDSSGGVITKEVVWNTSATEGTGGGVSDVFPVPAWQAPAGVPPSANPGARVGRGVPDVAGDADPATGYQIVAQGKAQTVGATSAVTPL
jgi:kumamolisin